jgi:hypothetical protein
VGDGVLYNMHKAGLLSAYRSDLSRWDNWSAEGRSVAKSTPCPLRPRTGFWLRGNVQSIHLWCFHLCTVHTNVYCTQKKTLSTHDGARNAPKWPSAWGLFSHRPQRNSLNSYGGGKNILVTEGPLWNLPGTEIFGLIVKGTKSHKSARFWIALS